MWEVFNRQRGRAEEIVTAILRNQRALGQPGATIDDEALTDREACHRLFAKHGLLGIGIDVQGTIALAAEGGPSLPIEPEWWKEVKRMAVTRYHQACNQLRTEKDAARCFEWSEELIQASAKGRPLINEVYLRGWLKRIAGNLSDRNRRPADLPRANREVSTDPEAWGVWCSCNPWLATWRDLVRSCPPVLRDVEGGAIRPDYQIVPTLRSNPHVGFIAALDIQGVRPRSGHRLLVCHLPDLAVHCFAVLCLNRYAIRGRLYEALQESSWLEALASRLAKVLKAQVDNAEAQSSWTAIIKALLECFPLGLPPELVRVYLQVEHRIELPGSALVDRMQAALAKEFAAELDGFFGVAGLHGRESLRRREPELTLAGRLTERLSSAQARQQVYLLSIDEVMKAILFQLVASGYRLVAIVEKEFVLEIPEACDPDAEVGRVLKLVRDAQLPLLGELAAPCRCEWRLDW